MKRAVYVAAFTVLGILAQFIVHAVLEMGMIGLLTKDFERYGLGLTWDQWYLVHCVLTALLLIAGAWIGYRQGKYWWRVMYVERRYRKA